MRLKSIIAPLLFSACVLPFLLSASAACAEDLQLQDNPPDRYTVQKGDTLWGISAKFLKQPWRWPEIWRMNRDQIKNPHLIYPGDVIALDKVNGEWRLSLVQGGQGAQRDSGPRGDVRLSPSIRVDSLDAEAIPSIPPGDLSPFLSLPLVTDADGIPGAAKIIAARDNRVIRGVGDFVYAINVDEKSGTQWYIYRPGKVLHSFDSNEKLGYEMRYLGTARVDRFGEVARMEITTAREEILFNDLLIPAPKEELVNYVPHSPDKIVDGRIIALGSNSAEGGRGSIITLDRGLRDGLEVGNVLAIYHPTPVIPDPRAYEGPDVLAKFLEQTRTIVPPTTYLNIPPERSGLLFVFRAFDKVSYALVLNAAEPVVIGDLVRKP
jgi:hypothetical protein